MIEWQFESVIAFIRMTPHGLYVWSVYGFGAAVLGGLTLWLRWSSRQTVDRIRRQIEREGLDESET